jgi:hypothetical protein
MRARSSTLATQQAGRDCTHRRSQNERLVGTSRSTTLRPSRVGRRPLTGANLDYHRPSCLPTANAKTTKANGILRRAECPSRRRGLRERGGHTSRDLSVRAGLERAPDHAVARTTQCRILRVISARALHTLRDRQTLSQKDPETRRLGQSIATAAKASSHCHARCIWM